MSTGTIGWRVLRMRVESLLSSNFDFMDSNVLRRKYADKKLFAVDFEPELPLTSWYQPTRHDAPEISTAIPQLMSAAEERLMFYRFNYCKMRLSQLKRKFCTDDMTVKMASEFLEWHRKFEHIREYLIRTNLALVLAMAKRFRVGELDFADVVSEGNMALLRAVDKFDVDRGFKFSTYSCRAILKAFSRTAMKTSRHRMRFPVEFEPDYEKSNWQEQRHQAVAEDCIDDLKVIVDRNLADLSDIEHTVIRRRFNWKQVGESSLTLDAVGQIIGVTKERVRQIQNKALAKIRAVMEDCGERSGCGTTTLNGPEVANSAGRAISESPRPRRTRLARQGVYATL
jgi:RNA polymerase primary sigma factor